MKISNLSVKSESSSSDTLLVLTASGEAHRITMGQLISAVYSDDTFRNNLIEQLVDSQHFQDTAKTTIIALLEQLREIPSGSTEAFMNFIRGAQNGDTQAVAPSGTMLVGPNLTLSIE